MKKLALGIWLVTGAGASAQTYVVSPTINGTITVNSPSSQPAGLSLLPSTGQDAILSTTGGSGNLVINEPGLFILKENNTIALIVDTNPQIKTEVPIFLDTTGTVSNSYSPAIRYGKGITGSDTLGTTVYDLYLQVSSDNANLGNPSTAQGLVAKIDHTFGGSGMTGDRNTLQINSTFTGGTSNNATYGLDTGATSLQIYTNMSGSDNGTALLPRSTVWSINTVTQITGSTANAIGMVGYELDMRATSGTSYLDNLGLHIAEQDDHVVQGSRTDAAIVIDGSKSGTLWGIGLQFGLANGKWASNNILIGAVQNTTGSPYTMQANYGVDYHLVTFNNCSWYDAKFCLTGNGHFAATGASPSITSGTATLDAKASDVAGTVTEGTSQTGFTLTFASAYATTPHCTISSPTGSSFTSYTPSTTTLVVVNASATGNKYSYTCMQ